MEAWRTFAVTFSVFSVQEVAGFGVWIESLDYIAGESFIGRGMRLAEDWRECGWRKCSEFLHCSNMLKMKICSVNCRGRSLDRM